LWVSKQSRVKMADAGRSALLCALVALVSACKSDALVIEFPDAPRSGARISCGGSSGEGGLREVSFFVTSSCSTDSPLEIRVENDVQVPVFEESRPLTLIAGRAEPLSVKLTLPRQSMQLTLQVTARCHPKAAHGSIFERATCVAE
jgi:hypothetical protein